jgi:hypothetical protein
LRTDYSPFSYHLYLKYEIEKAIETGQIHKYHFNYLRNILEKMSTFLGHQNWGDLLEPVRGDRVHEFVLLRNLKLAYRLPQGQSLLLPNV